MRSYKQSEEQNVVPKDSGGAPPSGGGAGSGGRNTERDFHGEKRSNTHCSITDPDAPLFREGPEKRQGSVFRVRLIRVVLLDAAFIRMAGPGVIPK